MHSSLVLIKELAAGICFITHSTGIQKIDFSSGFSSPLH